MAPHRLSRWRMRVRAPGQGGANPRDDQGRKLSRHSRGVRMFPFRILEQATCLPRVCHSSRRPMRRGSYIGARVPIILTSRSPPRGAVRISGRSLKEVFVSKGNIRHE